MIDAIAEVMRFFKYDHLPQKAQVVSKPFCDLAQVVFAGPTSFQTLTSLQHLLEAKDAAVRAAL